MGVKVGVFFVKLLFVFSFLILDGVAQAAAERVIERRGLAGAEPRKKNRVVYRTPGIFAQETFCYLETEPSERFPTFCYKPRGFSGDKEEQAYVYYEVPRDYVLSEEVRKDLTHICGQRGLSATEQEAPPGYGDLLAHHRENNTLEYGRIQLILATDRWRRGQLPGADD